MKNTIWNPKPKKINWLPQKSRYSPKRTQNLIFGFDFPKTSKAVGKKALNWPQAKKKYPKLSPFADSDRDGVQNWLDCRPFDRTRQMVFKESDAGRAKAGYKCKRDCVTRALATVKGIPYTEAREILKKKLKGKDPGAGVPKKITREVMKEQGLEWTPIMGIGTGTTVHVKEGELPRGKNVLSLSGHMIASEDQDWIDTEDPSRGGKRAVYGYFHLPEKVDNLSEEESKISEEEPEEVKEELIKELEEEE